MEVPGQKCGKADIHNDFDIIRHPDRDDVRKKCKHWKGIVPKNVLMCFVCVFILIFSDGFTNVCPTLHSPKV